jgi:hypothetical protein
MRKPKGKRGSPAKYGSAADAKMCEDWMAAKAAGATREDFCRSRNMRVGDLIAFQDRVRYRKNASAT